MEWDCKFATLRFGYWQLTSSTMGMVLLRFSALVAATYLEACTAAVVGEGGSMA